jgi:CheY-like chemotaxis protein
MAKKILLADDSITIQKVVELTFSEGDYEVHCVGNGAQAIRKIDEIVPDIALVDVMMPQRNGYEVCSHVKQDPKLSWIPVLLLTGTFEPFDPRRAEQAGADGHITKPFESRALVAQVEDLLTGHPRPRSAETERLPIQPAPRPERSEIVNSGQIFPSEQAPSAPAAGPAPREEAVSQMSGPATVRIDSRAFFAQLQQEAPGGADVIDAAPAGGTPSLGPLDLGSEETEGEPTHPFRAVPPKTPPAPEPPRPEIRIPAPAAASAPSRTPEVSPEDVQRILHERIDAQVRGAIGEAVDRVLREVAWEILPEVAERMVRQRISELEKEAAGGPPAPQVH